MSALALHTFHARCGASFAEVNGAEVVAHYGDPLAEHAALRQAVAVLDLSSRARLCVLGRDRERFLNGQVTNDVRALRPGQGCYAALVNAKGRMEGDAFIYRLAEEFLLDGEPGCGPALAQRLTRFVIADDVQIADAAPHYGLWSVQGPQAAAVVGALALNGEPPARPLSFTTHRHPDFGELYVMNQPRVSLPGFDLFVPLPAMEAFGERLLAAARAHGGRLAGWEALETARIEAGIPRFGADMDNTTLPPEAGLGTHAISYTKGCFIGQEVLARIRTYGHVNRTLCGLRLADELPELPTRGDVLLKNGQEVGQITSAARSPAWRANLALGYVHRDHNTVGTTLTLRSRTGESPVQITLLPFLASAASATPPA
jgi:folate-binding protein YgfZ